MLQSDLKKLSERKLKSPCLGDWSLFIGRGGGGAGANRGWATIFYAWLKGGAIKKYAKVLPAKMLKAASGCQKQIQPIKIALYNIFY